MAKIKNVDLTFQRMMQAHGDSFKPKATVMRQMRQVEMGCRMIETGVLLDHSQRYEKNKRHNELFDSDSMVPEHMKQQASNSLTEAARLLAKQSNDSRKAKAA